MKSREELLRASMDSTSVKEFFKKVLSESVREPIVCTFSTNSEGAFPDESVYKEIVLEYNAPFYVLPEEDPIRPGYDFVGWFVDEETQITNETPVNGPIDCFSKWSKILYTISFDVDNYWSEPITQTLSVGMNEHIENAPIPTRVKCDFEGWYVGDVCYVDSTGQSVREWDKLEGDTLKAHWTSTFGWHLLKRNAERYDNQSIKDFLDFYTPTHTAANDMYTVRYPLYEYGTPSSTESTGLKQNANENLVLELSTDTYEGRNDYKDIKLFYCGRVNGGCDLDGMPYVTAMEDMGDPEFSAIENNTYALTPVYYRYKIHSAVTTLSICSYYYNSNFHPCYGAYIDDDQTVLRPYILRACYDDHDGNFSSKSGTVPASTTVNTIQGCYQHSNLKDFNDSKNNTTNGLSYLTYGDVQYLMDFMQIMLGVKAPKTIVKGLINHWINGEAVTVAQTNQKSVIVANSTADKTDIGCYISVGTVKGHTAATAYNIAEMVKVIGKETYNSSNTKLLLELDQGITTTTSNVVTGWKSRNGQCDNVRGTFGTPTAEGATNGTQAFKFQNMEWLHGVYHVVANMYHNGANVYMCPDIKVAASPDTSDLTGWEIISTTLPTAQGYIGDYNTDNVVPLNVSGTATTGYQTYMRNNNAGNRCWWVGGSYGNAAYYGVGCVRASNTVSDSSDFVGGRSSTIGKSSANGWMF